MGKKKKAFEMNFGTLLLIIIGICCIIFAFKNFSKENSFKFDVDYIVSFLKSCFSYQNVLCLFFIILMTFCYLTGNISGSQRAVSEFDIFEILKFLLYSLLR